MGRAASRVPASSDDAGPVLDDDDLAVRLGRLARSLQGEQVPLELLERAVRGAVELVPGAEQGSISLVAARRHITSLAASGPLPLLVDALQEETGQGPCTDAAYRHETVRVPDMAAEERWPLFAARAAAAGAGSMLCFQLYVEDDDLGALNLYSATRGAFTDESEHVGLLVAAHAAVAYASAAAHARLERAVEHRGVVGQAVGILVERHRLTAEAAFGLLVTASQHSNRKLHAVADELVRTGELPGPAGPRPQSP